MDDPMLQMLHDNELRVFKYPLTRIMARGWDVVMTREDARVVLVGHQDHVPTVWMEVSLKKPEARRSFTIYGTGHTISDDDNHVGSYIDGAWVWHIYESNP